MEVPDFDLDKVPTWGDDVEELDTAELTCLTAGERDLDDATQDKYKGLDADLSYLTAPRVRTFADLQHVKLAKDHIKRLPAEGESMHMVVSGRYPLWAMVPAIHELSGQPIAELDLITLSYGKDNAQDMLDMIDAGKIGHVR